MIYSTTYLFSLSISHLVRDYEGRSALCDASHLKNNRLVLDGSDNVKPFLGFGYAQERYVRNDATHYIEGYSFRHNESVASGFGVMLGISYDYSITEHWSLGVLYERGLNICEHNIFGLHARYSF